MELVEFLLARIAEDERYAQSAIGEARPDWVVGVEETSDGENAFWAVEALGESSEWFADLGSKASDSARAAHIARHDPARVLADCEAKRRIVESRAAISLPSKEIHDEVQRQREYVWKLLALPYADHPSYDAGWKP